MLPLFYSFKRIHRLADSILTHIENNPRYDNQQQPSGLFFPPLLTEKDISRLQRFIFLMVHFTSPDDLLHYQRVWKFIKREFPNELSSDTQRDLDTIIATRIRRYDSDLLMRLLPSLPVFWFDYRQEMRDILTITAKLFRLINDLEHTPTYYSKYPDILPPDYKCIFCLQSNKSFKSVEHIFPEVLGNTELLLAKGFVCDDCNNGKLADLDNALSEVPSVAIAKLWCVMHGKEGNPTTIKFHGGVATRNRLSNLHFRYFQSDSPIKLRRGPDNTLMMESTINVVQSVTMRLVARAAYKIALELVALSFGHSRACSPRYDAARSFVLKDTSFDNNFLYIIPQSIKCMSQVSMEEQFGGTVFMINLYGTRFLLNLESLPELSTTNKSKLIPIEYQGLSLK